jgi:hypothetical protein
VPVVLLAQQPRHIVGRPSPERDVHAHADQESDHPVQEPIGFNGKDKSFRGRSLVPHGLDHAAAIMGTRRPGCGERPEVVLAGDASGDVAERGGVEGTAERPLPGTAEG